jgi:hypothetical protein
VSRETNRAVAVLTRIGRVGDQEVAVHKDLLLGRDADGFEAAVKVENRSTAPLEGRYGLELNFALLSPEFADAFVHSGNQAPLCGLGTRNSFGPQRALGLCDRIRGLNISVSVLQEADFFLMPVQTLSRAESGFETILQSVCVMPVWNLWLEPGKAFQATLIVRFELLNEGR